MRVILPLYAFILYEDAGHYGVMVARCTYYFIALSRSRAISHARANGPDATAGVSFRHGLFWPPTPVSRYKIF